MLTITPQTCLSESTRSDDLFMGHKRSCGDLGAYPDQERQTYKLIRSPIRTRSRRKSCQACAESKIRCDSGQPCRSCTLRGKECIYIHDPAQSRERIVALAARRGEARRAAADSIPTVSKSFSRLPHNGLDGDVRIRRAGTTQKVKHLDCAPTAMLQLIPRWYPRTVPTLIYPSKTYSDAVYVPSDWDSTPILRHLPHMLMMLRYLSGLCRNLQMLLRIPI